MRLVLHTVGGISGIRETPVHLLLAATNQPYTLSLSSWGVGVGSDKQAVYQALSEREEPLFPLGFLLSQS